ncbi:hypothetical protein RYX36_033310 [Vicia faba]
MCLLLSTTTHVVANIVEEEESESIEEVERGPSNQGKSKQCLLTPPQTVLMEANQVIAKATKFVSRNPVDSGLAEIEKMYEIAISGSDEEKISAATILCGASIVRGWNIQEHNIIFITMLLTPVGLPNHTETESHLISPAQKYGKQKINNSNQFPAEITEKQKGKIEKESSN